VLLDVEGTTTPLAFVREVLFPYAAARLETWCARAGGDPRVRRVLDELAAEHAREPDPGRPALGDGAPYARWLMQRDRKSTALKTLQGLIWEEGYRAGELRGAVYPDVPRAFARWRAAGLRIRIFSSGSVLAQRLLFAHSDHGDLSRCVEGYHDTTTGSKQARASYTAIAGALRLRPAEVLFVSDTPAELAAAAEAGMATARVARAGDALPAGAGGTAFPDLDAL
jgi:enolase-phosphatase E1